jgi:hypothetical protein
MDKLMSKTEWYLFVLAIALVILAYYAGANKLLGTAFSGVNTLGLTFTGRNSNGQFAAYPSNAPTA